MRSSFIKVAGILAILCGGVPSSLAQDNPERPRRVGGFGGPIVLGPDDVAVYAAPPDGFNTARENVPHGKLELIEYESKTVGTKRKANVYTPPGYAADKKYPCSICCMGSVAMKPNGCVLPIPKHCLIT